MTIDRFGNNLTALTGDPHTTTHNYSSCKAAGAGCETSIRWTWANAHYFLPNNFLADDATTFNKRWIINSQPRAGVAARWDFAVHAIVGTLIFAIIASSALGLDIFTAWLDQIGIDQTIRLGLKIAEYAVLLTDLVLFLLFLAKTGARAVRKF